MNKKKRDISPSRGGGGDVHERGNDDCILFWKKFPLPKREAVVKHHENDLFGIREEQEGKETKVMGGKKKEKKGKGRIKTSFCKKGKYGIE